MSIVVVFTRHNEFYKCEIKWRILRICFWLWRLVFIRQSIKALYYGTRLVFRRILVLSLRWRRKVPLRHWYTFKRPPVFTRKTTVLFTVCCLCSWRYHKSEDVFTYYRWSIQLKLSQTRCHSYVPSIFCETDGVTSQKTVLFIGYFYVHFRYVRLSVVPSAVRFPTVYFILSLSLSLSKSY